MIFLMNLNLDDKNEVDLTDSHVGFLLKGGNSLDVESITCSYHESLDVECDLEENPLFGDDMTKGTCTDQLVKLIRYLSMFVVCLMSFKLVMMLIELIMTRNNSLCHVMKILLLVLLMDIMWMKMS